MLDAQQRALAHVRPRFPFVPRVVAARNGSSLVEVRAPDGRSHWVWAVTWIDGVPFAQSAWRPATLLAELGSRVGVLTGALADFDHPAAHREFYWDLAHGRAAVHHLRPMIADADLCGAIDRLMADFDRVAAPRLAALRRSVVHGDLNDYNILVHDAANPARCEPHVAGIVDFGDMVYTYTVADLAIACAYVMLDATDPVAAAAHVVRGYHAAFPLTEDEVATLYALIILRLAMSAAIAADQMHQQPHQQYLAVSQAPIRRTLPKLVSTPFRLAEAVFRDACGWEPAPLSKGVVTWLRAQTAGAAPVLGVDLRREPCIVLDWSVASPMFSGDWTENTEPVLTRHVFEAMRAAGVSVAVGRYDEARLRAGHHPSTYH